uniref:hypothetical protein n=1 Tax=Streptomyces sp. NBC_01001 TaxID=2903713 RepID=UPI002F906D52
MAFRLEEIETDLIARRARAEAEGWLGEIEGMELTLMLLRQKQAEAVRLTGMPQPLTLAFPHWCLGSRGDRPHAFPIPTAGARRICSSPWGALRERRESDIATVLTASTG